METLCINQLRQNEVSGLVIALLEIVEKHNPEIIGIKPIYDLLKEVEPELKLMTNPRIKHPLTDTINSDVRLAEKLCTTIGIQIRAMKYSGLESLNDSLYLMEPLVEKYLSRSYLSNRVTFTNRISDYLTAVNISEEMSNAASAIGIDMYITELGAAKTRMKQNIAIRDEYNVSRRNVMAKQLRVKANKAVSNLLKALELAKVTNTTFDFDPLNTELDILFIKYRTLLLSRITRKINKSLYKESVATTTTSAATEPLNDEPI